VISDAQPRLRVIFLNAWGGALFEDLTNWIPTAAADILCLQEVTRTADLSGWTNFRDGARSLPQRADLFDDVRRLLPGHQALFDASDAGPVADDLGQVHRQEFGLGMFVTAGAPIAARSARFVHGEFTDHSDWPVDGRPRVAQAVRLEHRGRPVLIVHVHGLRVGGGKGDTEARQAQADRLADLVEECRRPGDLVILGGDLNLLPSSETFAILGRAGLVDLVGPATTRTSHYSKEVRHASYLLVSDPSAVARFEIVRAPEVSDHCPLLVEI
jgi:endonuclease/exonuclease/phosphatase family metal-dependent hydrolase